MDSDEEPCLVIDEDWEDESETQARQIAAEEAAKYARKLEQQRLRYAQKRAANLKAEANEAAEAMRIQIRIRQMRELQREKEEEEEAQNAPPPTTRKRKAMGRSSLCNVESAIQVSSQNALMNTLMPQIPQTSSERFVSFEL
jgi:hypothetical protein